MIPDEAVEASARVIADREGHPTIWDYDAETARAALEAALPHMRFELQCMSMIDEME